MAAGEKTITTTNDEPKAAKPAKGEDVTKAQTEAREAYEESHKFTGDQLTPEEYYAVGREPGAKVRDAVPGEDTLPQSSVLKPKEG